MSRQFSVSQLILFLFVVVMGIIIGGGVYEARVLVPLWSSAPPDSVTAYYQHNVADLQFVPDQGRGFWIFVTPSGIVLTIATLISAFWTQAEHRRWRLTAAVISLIVYVATVSWFVPNIIRLMSSDVMTMGRDELVSLADWWVNLNWVRAALLMTAWLAALKALTIPPNGEARS